MKARRLLAVSTVAIMLAMLVPMTADTADATTPPGGFIASKWTYGTNYASNGENTGLTFSGPTRTSDFRTAYGQVDWGTGAYEICFKLRLTETGNDGTTLYISLRPDVASSGLGGEIVTGASLVLNIYRINAKLSFSFYGEVAGVEMNTYFLSLNQDYWFHASRYCDGGVWKQTLKYWTGSATYENPTWQVTESIPRTRPSGPILVDAKYLQLGNLNTGSSSTGYRLSGSITDPDWPWPPIEFTSRPSVANIIKTVDGRTVTASTVAENYTGIIWDMGDGTTYSGVTQVRHVYDANGTYTVRVTAYDDLGRNATTSTAVQIGESETAALYHIVEQYGVPVLAAAGILVLVAYALGARHPLVIVVGIALLVIAGLLHLEVLP